MRADGVPPLDVPFARPSMLAIPTGFPAAIDD
ncbi:hypothetical protein A2U01_0053475, partial [Trifolium medium]|nr:hypothetical protein [Trifolium medium]